MNEHYVLVKIDTNNSISLLKTLYNMSIYVYQTKYEPNSLSVKISYRDYKKINKFFKCHIIKHYNLFGLKYKILNNKIIVFGLLFFLLFSYLLSNIILEVKVIHTNPEIREVITRELKDYNIKKYTMRKDYDSLNKIKNEVTINNPTLIEWMEIESVGMKYIIRVEERIITNNEDKNYYCNLVASKNGLITRFNISKGELQIESNKYVKEGDILVSGAINYNEENKNNVCANGKVYANTWYTMNIRLNKKRIENVKTGRKRYNLKLQTKNKDFLIFRSRLENYETESKKILSVFNNILSLETDYEIETKEREYSEEEIDALINKEVEIKIRNLLKEDYTIINKKVLKKSINNSIIDIDMFIVVEENIAKEQRFELE